MIQGTQGGDYGSQTESQPPERMSDSLGDLRPTLRQVISAHTPGRPPRGFSRSHHTQGISRTTCALLFFPGHCSSPPRLTL